MATKFVSTERISSVSCLPRASASSRQVRLAASSGARNAASASASSSDAPRATDKPGQGLFQLRIITGIKRRDLSYQGLLGKIVQALELGFDFFLVGLEAGGLLPRSQNPLRKHEDPNEQYQAQPTGDRGNKKNHGSVRHL